ncbi:hypothetical protein SS1G_04787 [Sclerotinia sclerotiorum 1980 UF-70]|uniref:Uncharacterized protein n=1 Tax=Sclerotinia sclerotiorum (strain ATCC 18683 / 1980 / Ss-1) TaxID=665079 RepID=A7EHJ5_SCLS1|nr:hypothetical protein SS1G_04787 [Sclerotinia sclerotiorum 1980 UF-70]EDO02311.1 hypothetical protein SS1G_04787 [Sclerotinia sclerotiorum 1980 UF-70]
MPFQNFLVDLPLSTPVQREKNLPSVALAILPAIPEPYIALPAKFDACPNLSHLENANVFVTVKLNAITIHVNLSAMHSILQRIHYRTQIPQEKVKLTDQRQPNKLKPKNSHKSQPDPKQWLRVKRKPEKPAIRRVYNFGIWIRGFKNPVRVARCRIYFIPPTQSDEATTGDIFKVVEIGSEEKDSYYEDQDTI